MTRTRGRALVGERLVAKIPHGHWKTTTLIAALCLGGIRCSTVVDGAVNGDVFEAFAEQVLVPQLQAGDLVILDNLSSHKRARTRQLIEAAGRRCRFCPRTARTSTRSKLIFSKIKQLLRSMACRTREALWSAMQTVLDKVSASDAANCFTHCGYTLHLD